MGKAGGKTNKVSRIFHLWPFGILVAVWLMFVSPYVLHGLVPFPSKYLATFFPPWSAVYGMPVKNNAMPDVITQIFPWKHVTVASWHMGEIPLWNPYSFSGTQLAGNYQSAVFSPVNLLFFLLPFVHAWSIMILLQPILAGIFMYLFLRSLARSTAASVFGGISFMFCGFIVVWMAYGTLAYAAAFLPLSLFAVNKISEKKRWGGALLSASLALSLLSGHFQISLYVLLAVVLYITFLRLWFAFFSVLFGVLLASPQILLAYHAYESATRSGMFLKGEIIPWQYLITLFSPDFFGNPVTRNDWFGHYAEWATFIGVVPLAMVITSWFYSRKERVVWFFTFLGVGAVLFALPTPLTNLMYAAHIPVLSTSAASRIVVLFSFSFAVLAAFGLDALSVLSERSNWRRFLVWGGTIIGFLILFWFVLRVIKPFPPDKLSVAVHNSILPSILALCAVISVFGVSLLPRRFRKILPYLFVLFAAGDLYRYAAKWMPFDPASYMYPELPVIKKMQELVSTTGVRVFGNIGEAVGSTFGVPLTEGYDAVYQARYGEFISAAADGRIGTLNRSVVQLDKNGTKAEIMLRLLGVRYLVHRISDGRFSWAYPYWRYPGYRLIWKDATYEIYQNDAALPRAFLVSSYRAVQDDAHALSLLLSPDFDRRNSVIVDTGPSITPQPGPGSVRIVVYKPDAVTIETRASVPKLLFLSDVFDPGWHAAVDGKPVKLFRADFDFRAVPVPAGLHTVTMWYWPDAMTEGLILAGFATLGCIGLAFIKRKS